MHLQLWRNGYRYLPYVGPMFLGNVAASVMVAVALSARRDRWAALAGLALAAGSLAALALSRTIGIAGFMEPGLSAAALRTIAAETGALVALGVAITAGSPRPAPVVVRPW